MSIIYAPLNVPPVELSVTELRAMLPNVSYSSIADLAPFFVFLTIPTTPPDVDARLQKIVPAPPELTDAGWEQRWNVRPATTEEIAEYDAANEPPPQWVSFGAAVQRNPRINALLGTALQQAPALGMGLAVGLGKAADGDSRSFSQAWADARAAGLVPAELLEAVVAMAGQFHLPATFVEALEAPPPPTALGEEWQSPSGRIYRVVQLQGEDGQFLPDDPATPQRESLGWVVVQP